MDDDEEYEEVLVYVHLPDMDVPYVKDRDSPDAIDSMVLKNVDGESPAVQINGMDLKGQYLHNLGSQAFFQLTPTIITPKVEPRSDNDDHGNGKSGGGNDDGETPDVAPASKPAATFVGITDVKLSASFLQP